VRHDAPLWPFYILPLPHTLPHASPHASPPFAHTHVPTLPHTHAWPTTLSHTLPLQLTHPPTTHHTHTPHPPTHTPRTTHTHTHHTPATLPCPLPFCTLRLCHTCCLPLHTATCHGHITLPSERMYILLDILVSSALYMHRTLGTSKIKTRRCAAARM